MADPQPTQPIELFYSYSHKDEKLREKLETHLSLLKRQGVIAGWHDRKIGAGQEWANQIDEHLNTDQIILLLVSADFLASDYCYDVEMRRAMERHEAGEAHIIPIILRPCDWHSAPFGKLQALPKDAKPVIDWSSRDTAFLDVAKGIRSVAEDMAPPHKHQISPSGSPSVVGSSIETTSVPGNQSASSSHVFQSDPRQDNAAHTVLIDFVILTALEVERRAVCAAFGLTDDQRERRDSRVYWRGRLPLKNGEFYEIVVAQSPDMANVEAALLTSDALHHWKPGAALMVGIAAAASEEQHLGDVIVGSDVYYYERGKVKQEGVKPEPKMYPADATLWNNVNALPDWTTEILAERPDGTTNRPKVRKGVIGSGEKVIAYKAVRDQIASGHRKIIAIEMEGYGFSAAVWQSFQQVRHLVIRGICDLADSSKNDAWHPYAAASAASFAKHFLLDRPLEPRSISARARWRVAAGFAVLVIFLLIISLKRHSENVRPSNPEPTLIIQSIDWPDNLFHVKAKTSGIPSDAKLIFRTKRYSDKKNSIILLEPFNMNRVDNGMDTSFKLPSGYVQDTVFSLKATMRHKGETNENNIAIKPITEYTVHKNYLNPATAGSP